MSDSVFIIAEIGSNHNGDLATARRLVELAAAAGSDAVKFQSFLADELVVTDAAEYPMLTELELPRAWYPLLQEQCVAAGVIFFSTATNLTTIGWLEECGVELYKIASPNLTDHELLRATARLKKDIILSTGLATIEEITEAVEVIKANSQAALSLLHCVSDYPTDPKDVNLRFMQTLHKVFKVPVGFSDHTLGLTTAVAAVALGAQIIEKHITLSRSASGPDHHFSMEPEEFKEMVAAIRQTEAALGNPRKQLSAGELAKREQYHRSLHAKKNIFAGEKITAEAVKIVRPATGLAPKYLAEIINKSATKDIAKDEPITWNNTE